MNKPTLEHAAQQIAEATSKPPFLYDLGPEDARKVLDDIQAAPVPKLDVHEKWITVSASVGDVQVRIVKPVGAAGPLPTILYVHGGGWILGNAGTHDRLVRELAVGVNAAVAFVEYDRSPEAQYPVAIEQAYATAQWITRQGSSEGLDGSRLAVVGDSVGGNMTAALAILAKQRGDVTFVHQSLYYPVTDAAQDTDGYREFAEGPFLRAKSMACFWDAYCPDRARRSEITASPLRATTAIRTADGNRPAPFDVKPVLVLTGESNEQAAAFHDGVSVGAKLRLFGAMPIGPAATDAGDRDQVMTRFWIDLPRLTLPHATNYRRWWNAPWSVVEFGGQRESADWTPEDNARLRTLVAAAHDAGLFVRMWTVNGHLPQEEKERGWSAGYNVGSLQAAQTRWGAAIEAGVDFIATDQYEAFAAVLAGVRPISRSPRAVSLASVATPRLRPDSATTVRRSQPQSNR